MLYCVDFRSNNSADACNFILNLVCQMKPCCDMFIISVIVAYFLPNMLVYTQHRRGNVGEKLLFVSTNRSSVLFVCLLLFRFDCVATYYCYKKCDKTLILSLFIICTYILLCLPPLLEDYFLWV